jgi:hypothetical protein
MPSVTFPLIFRGLAKILLEPRDKNSTLRFHLTFRSSSHQSRKIQFDLSSDEAMAFLHALQTLQRKHAWRVPFGPQRGKPNLTIVSSDDDE